MRKQRTAFTLIELLIVVAIIAILAAIAVPNFLEAQTRAKVSRVYSDMRTAAVGLEAYKVDNREYAPSHWEGVNNDDFIEPPQRRFNALTTPVAYLTKSLPPSPFKPAVANDMWSTYYQYSTKKGLLKWPRGGAPDFPQGTEGHVYLNGWYRLGAGQSVYFNPPSVFTDGPAWMILDRGPDTMYFYVWVNPSWVNLPGPGIEWEESIAFYDPTNGTVSMGEIMRSQMVSSFK
jgi:prepilin-type N-terminal cleavage/methylation domain-containing protein